MNSSFKVQWWKLTELKNSERATYVKRKSRLWIFKQPMRVTISFQRNDELHALLLSFNLTVIWKVENQTTSIVSSEITEIATASVKRLRHSPSRHVQLQSIQMNFYKFWLSASFYKLKIVFCCLDSSTGWLQQLRFKLK